MLKVFLVEDEIIIREGIKNNIDWEREGFAFVGEASDGELAYPLIQQTRPDIHTPDRYSYAFYGRAGVEPSGKAGNAGYENY